MRNNNVITNIFNTKSTNEHTIDDLKYLAIDFKEGNEYAFVDIFEVTFPVLMNIGRKYTRDEQVIQEAIQEAFIVVSKKIDQLADVEKFLNWIVVIFRNKVYDEFRKKAMIKEDSNDTAGTEYSSAFARSVCRKIEFNPEAKVLREELVKMVEKAIHLLPATQRVALLAYAYDNKSMEEIAYMMDCPVGTVKSRIYNARRAVRGFVNRFEQKEIG